MPKVVDPAERQLVLVEAVWKVIRRDGLEQASVRNVAREAGLSTGSLRHYFASQSALMVFAFRAVIDRIESRLAGLESEHDPRRRAQRVLAELRLAPRSMRYARRTTPRGDGRRFNPEAFL